MYSLVVKFEWGEQRHPLPNELDSIVVGRDADCDVRIDNPHVSRQQFRLTRSEAGWWFESDPDAKNPVEVNRQSPSDGPLKPGDEFLVAGISIVFESDLSRSGVHLTHESPGETLTLSPDQGREAFMASQSPRDRAKLAGLFAVSEALTLTDDPARLARRLLEVVAPALQASRGFLALAEDLTDPLASIDESGRCESIPMSQSVLDKIQIERAGVLVQSVQRDLRPLRADSIADIGIETFIAAPLLIGDETIGFIYFDRLRREHGSFDRDDLAYLQVVARECALALELIRHRDAILRENTKLRRILSREEKFIADCPDMQRVLRLIQRAADQSWPVLIQGETGTGKEYIARAIHESSPRRDGPFVTFNCSQSTPELIESKLFGTREGGFTGARDRLGVFEKANGGTVFLDEIGDMPSDVQTKLLRVQQDGAVEPVGADEPIPVDVRIVSATHRKIGEPGDREAIGFRDDFYFRIAKVTIGVPPLRDRGDDILAIAEQMLPDGVKMNQGARNAILSYSWSVGNIRELQQAIFQASLDAPGDTIRKKDLPGNVTSEGRGRLLDIAVPTLAALEEKHLRKVYAIANENKTRTARILGISRETLYQKLKGYGIEG